MELIKSKNANINYLAQIVEINQFHKHPDPEVTKLKCTYVNGYNIIVGIDSEPGKYIYFPTCSVINPQFLSFANLYRHGQLNSNPEQTGMFEDNGRVKAIKLRGCISEGFLLPIETFINWISSFTGISVDNSILKNNLEFDTVKHLNKSFWICHKYVVSTVNTHSSNYVHNKNQKRVKKFNRVIDTQFRLHYDTVQIKKLTEPIKPDDLIHISSKIHGTSGISAYVLTKYPINIFQKLGYWISKGVWENYGIKYDYVYSSRTVIKNRDFNPKVGNGYYNIDVWAEADKIVRPHLQKGMTAYYEIVGYLPNGKYIQKNYDYGCVPPAEGEEYTSEKHFKVRIYRITLTNVDGIVHEFSPREVQIWCEINNLTPVEEFYYGYAGDLYDDLYQYVNGERLYYPDWYERFLENLSNDEDFYMEKRAPDCINKVPQEGIVIKIDNGRPNAMKLKSFAFVNNEQKELDAGIENIEDNA